ncbi:unnamed protein product [Hermetia illucens]|uniref:Chitin-binding type-2 domain-containing protein n=1 Tax=Hermetia illucens TaxID=343691 RepID=A0A7R8YN02_HERIL|nr:uncharacterized protein LOC119659314 [Hermetia illucens]CAD7077955.1 unnamed protein product [Hermetia illucens]
MKLLSCGLLLAIFVCRLDRAYFSDVCTKWGYACRNNRSLIYCSIQDSNWIETDILQCGLTFVCEEQNGICIPAYTVGNRFDCQGEGIFPDPYQCGTYYVCYFNDGRMNKILARCPKGKYYSVVTNTCSLEEYKLQPSCPRPFVCEYPGQIGVWPRNRNIYYICALYPDSRSPYLYPKVFRCLEDMQFNGTQCVDRPHRNRGLGSLLDVAV